MKKTLIAIAVCLMGTCASAQVLKGGLLNGYKDGDVLEKNVYVAKDDAAKLDTWSGAAVSKPTDVQSPVIGAALSYPGYNEAGPSIKLGTPKGVKGTRFSVYTIDTKKAYSKGVLYLSFLCDFSRLGGSSSSDLLGLSANATGASNRAAVKVVKDGTEGYRFAVTANKTVSECPKVCDYDKTHLLVLKLDYDKQTVSLFVDPKAGAEEPAPCVVAMPDAEHPLKHAIRSISLRNRSGHNGSVGNIRLAASWASVFE